MDDENFQKRIGKGMTIVGWIILLGLLTVYFNKYLDKQTNPNQQLSLIQNGEFKEIQLQRNRFGHYVANGSINNKTVVFILDTGATEISIPEKVARKLNLKAGISFPVQTANGQINVFSTSLDRVNLGGIELYNISANINPYMQGEEVLLGMSFLKHLDFSQQGDQLIIRQY